MSFLAEMLANVARAPQRECTDIAIQPLFTIAHQMKPIPFWLAVRVRSNGRGGLLSDILSCPADIYS